MQNIIVLSLVVPESFREIPKDPLLISQQQKVYINIGLTLFSKERLLKLGKL